MLKPVSLVASGRPRDVSNYFWGGPKASKSAPRGIQERSIRPWKPSSGISSLSKSSKRPLRRRQETSRAHLAAILVPCWSNFAAQSKRCCHHVGHVSSLKAASPRALDPRPKAWRNARERLTINMMAVMIRRGLWTQGVSKAFSTDTKPDSPKPLP